jgi:hypothetical protein
MSEESWRFRVTRGVVTIRGDAIAIRSTPGYFLAGQRSRWRHGGRWDRAKLALNAVGLLWSVLQVAYHFSRVGVAGVGWMSVPYALAFAFFAWAFWSNHVGETTIPLSAVDTVTLNEADGELVVKHERDRGYLAPFGGNTTETTFSLPTEEDVSEAKEVLRFRGVDVQEPREEGTETTRRVLVRAGACFCERCRSQVSPADASCPGCGYTLRLRTSVDRPPDDTTEEAETA